MADLYRYTSNDGRLLYIGVSIHAGLRASQHRDRPWWPDVATITVEHFTERSQALAAERDAIIAERPVHNVVRGRDTIAATPERTRALAAERARRYRARRRGHEYDGPSEEPYARAKRRLRRGDRVADLADDEREALRAYNRMKGRERRDASGIDFVT